MKTCQSAGRQCPHEAVFTARIAGVGDRPLCQSCFDGYRVLMGEDIRAIDPNAYVPTWRTRGLARDESGLVRA